MCFGCAAERYARELGDDRYDQRSLPAMRRNERARRVYRWRGHPGEMRLFQCPRGMCLNRQVMGEERLCPHCRFHESDMFNGANVYVADVAQIP